MLMFWIGRIRTYIWKKKQKSNLWHGPNDQAQNATLRLHFRFSVYLSCWFVAVFSQHLLLIRTCLGLAESAATGWTVTTATSLHPLRSHSRLRLVLPRAPQLHQLSVNAFYSWSSHKTVILCNYPIYEPRSNTQEFKVSEAAWPYKTH